MRALHRRTSIASTLVALPLVREKVPGGSPRMRWIAEAVRKDALAWVLRHP